jgi:hypothetical protein
MGRPPNAGANLTKHRSVGRRCARSRVGEVHPRRGEHPPGDGLDGGRRGRRRPRGPAPTSRPTRARTRGWAGSARRSTARGPTPRRSAKSKGSAVASLAEGGAGGGRRRAPRSSQPLTAQDGELGLLKNSPARPRKTRPGSPRRALAALCRRIPRSPSRLPVSGVSMPGWSAVPTRRGPPQSPGLGGDPEGDRGPHRGEEERRCVPGATPQEPGAQ